MNNNIRNASKAVIIPLKGKIGYSFGEMGSQFSWTLISAYLMVFYSDVVGLTPVIISIIMLVARVGDAVSDPIFGSIAENTRSRYGRFRPWILWASPLLCLFNCLCFLNLNVSMPARIIWCAVTYIFCGMTYTAANISVGCLVNSMTSINTERVKLNAFRGAAGSIAGIMINMITMPIILYFGNGSTSSGKGYFIAAFIFSVVALPCFFICFFSTQEIIGGGVRKEDENEKNRAVKNLTTSFKITFKDRNATFMIFAMLCFLTGIFGRIGIMAYYFIYIMGNAIAIASFGTAMTIGMLVVNLYAPLILNCIDKKWCGVISCFCQAACCVAFFFLGQEHASAMTVAVVGFVYGATNFGGLTSYGLGAEIIDDNWLKTGIRADGVIYSCISFSTKLGNAIGGSIGILILGAVGFVANSEMSAEVLTKMNMVINLFPVAFFLLSALFFAMVEMTNVKGKENEAKIIEKLFLGELK